MPGYDYGAGIQGTGGLFGAASTIIGANSQYSAAEQNAGFLRKSADYDLLRGRLAQEDIDSQAGQVAQAQKVDFASQNVDLSSETVSQVREETFSEAQRAKNEAELDAAMSAWGKKAQAQIGVDNAAFNRRIARISATGQVIGSVGTIAAGAA